MDWIYCNKCWQQIAAPLDIVYERLSKNEYNLCGTCTLTKAGVTSDEVISNEE